MNPTRLLQHFDRISEAPDAIPHLRRFILDLAVRGKLVPQDPNDEPAAELLKRIQAEKARLVKEGKIRKTKALEPLAEGDIAFDIPPLWKGTRLGTVYDVRDGTHDTPKYVDAGYPLITSKNLSSGQLSFDDIKFISEQDHRQIAERSSVERGDILLAMIGSIGNPVIVDTDRPFSIKNVALFKYYDRAVLNPGFLCLFLQYAASEMQQLAAGGLQPFVSLGFLRNYPMPLPPLVEQHRIVAKVDELMTLCDQLEAAKTEREQSRDRLVAASLHHLNSPADAEEANTPDAFRDHARFYFIHLPRLTTRPEHLKQLRQTILNLAVRGRFSPEADWLKQPEALRAVALLQNGYAFKSEWFVPNGIRLLRNTNVGHGVLHWEELACLAENRTKEFERFLLSEGDIVLSLDRPFIVTGTKVARVKPQDMPCLLLQRVGRFQLNSDRLCPDYLFLCLHSPHFTNQLDPGRSNGVPHISSKQVEAVEIFVPPLAEQHRIVAKVDELMTLCDQLEAQLITTEADNRRLLEAVLHEALAPALAASA